MQPFLALFLCFQLLAPLPAQADVIIKTPFSYSLKDYGVILAISMLGGVVAFYAKVNAGEVKPWALTNLIGELCTSAFAGLIAFWLCEWGNVPPLLTAALVGISGHAGTAAITRFEAFAEDRFGSIGKRKDEGNDA